MRYRSLMLLAGMLLLMDTFAVANSINFDQLRTWIEADPKISLDALLEKISQHPRGRSLLQSASFVYDSRSQYRKDVNQKNPRAILHQNNLILAINGDPLKESYNNLEVIEYVPEKSQFAFYDVSFSPNAQPHIDEDPKSCRNCHGPKNQLHPLWHSGAVFPGVYGGHADRLPAISKERLAFLRFFRTKILSRRFATLGPSSDSVLSYPGSQGLVFKDKPNEKLFSKMSELNFKRIAGRLKRNSRYSSYRSAILGALLDCNGFSKPTNSSFLPRKVWFRHQRRLRKEYDELFLDTKVALHQSFRRKVHLYNREARMRLVTEDTRKRRANIFDPNKKDASVIAKLRFVLEGAAISMRHWSLSSKTHNRNYTFSSQSTSIRSLAKELDPKVGEEKKPKNHCESLRAASRSALKRRKPRTKMIGGF